MNKEYILDEHIDDFTDYLHAQHEWCGEDMCLDAGGGAIRNEDVLDYTTEEEYNEWVKERNKDGTN